MLLPWAVQAQAFWRMLNAGVYPLHAGVPSACSQFSVVLLLWCCSLQAQAFRRMLNAGVYPLHETAVVLIELLGSRGQAEEAEKVLDAMGQLGMDLQVAWSTIIGTPRVDPSL